MAGGMYGADIEALRALADRIDEGSTTLEGVISVVQTAIPDASGWGGPDAEGFRAEWGDTHAVRLRETASALVDVAAKVRDNADAQETTSNDYSGTGGTSSSNNDPSGTGDQRPGDIFDVIETGMGLTALGDAWKAIKYGLNLNNYLKALDGVGDLAAISSKMLHDARGIIGNLGAFGKWTGVLGGAFSIFSGVDQMFNPRYDGWRGGVDRVMGGIGAVGGVATIGMFMGAAAFTGPVGIGIAVGAGLVVGAWELGNLIYDNWDAISGFVSDPMPYLADGLDTVKDVAGDVGDAISDGWDAAGDFLGGIF